MAVEHGILELLKFVILEKNKNKKAQTIPVISLYAIPTLHYLCMGSQKTKDHIIKSDGLNLLLTLGKEEPIFLPEVLDGIISLTSSRPDLFEREGAQEKLIQPVFSLLNFKQPDPNILEKQLHLLTRFFQISRLVLRTFIASNNHTLFSQFTSLSL